MKLTEIKNWLINLISHTAKKTKMNDFAIEKEYIIFYFLNVLYKNINNFKVLPFLYLNWNTSINKLYFKEFFESEKINFTINNEILKKVNINDISEYLYTELEQIINLLNKNNEEIWFNFYLKKETNNLKNKLIYKLWYNSILDKNLKKEITIEINFKTIIYKPTEKKWRKYFFLYNWLPIFEFWDIHIKSISIYEIISDLFLSIKKEKKITNMLSLIYLINNLWKNINKIIFDNNFIQWILMKKINLEEDKSFLNKNIELYFSKEKQIIDKKINLIINNKNSLNYRNLNILIKFLNEYFEKILEN